MDPVSIGIATAALLGNKAAEEFATGAGTAAWQAVQRLGAAVRARLSSRASQALDQAGASKADQAGASQALDQAGASQALDHAGAEPTAVVAAEVERAVRADPAFGAELAGLIAEAGRDRHLAGVMAVAYDNARQVNIAGDNSGPITF